MDFKNTAIVVLIVVIMLLSVDLYECNNALNSCDAFSTEVLNSFERCVGAFTECVHDKIELMNNGIKLEEKK